MTKDYQIVIIGAGVIGLAVAKTLSESGYSSVLIIEEQETYGRGISSRSSEVIHSGIYYPKNSLKSKYCIKGKKLLYSFCNDYSINHRKCGKLIIGNKNQTSKIEQLYKNGLNNSISGIKIIKNDINNYEKHIKGDIALFIENTGIISSHEFMDRLYQISLKMNHDYIFKTKFQSSKKIDGGYKIYITNYYNNIESLTTNWVINCSGLNSDIISHFIADTPSLSFLKGCYFKLSSKWKNKFNHLVYPIPDENTDTLGIHLTFDNDGIPRLGPNAIKLKTRVEDYYVDDSLINIFYKEAKKYIKGLDIKDLSPDYAGIRPKINNLNKEISDFYINHEIKSGYPGWINLIGIESPGLTSSLAISEDIITIIKQYYDL